MATMQLTPRVDPPAMREEIRAFHLTGKGLDDGLPLEGLEPAGMEAFEQSLALREAAWPMFVAPGAAARPFLEILEAILSAGEPPFPAARELVVEITAAFAAASAEAGVAPVSEVVGRALEILAARNATLPAASEQLERDLRRLPASLPDDGLLVPFSSKALAWLHAAAIAESHGATRKAFRESLKQCRDRLRELLALEDSNSAAARSPENLASSLGGGVGAFFNAAALSAALRRPVQASKPMGSVRRARCEQAISVLDDAWRQSHEEPAFWTFALPGTSENPFTGKAIEAADPCAAAITFVEEQLNQAVPVFRALRIAKLELADAYVAAVHSPILERFGWETADDEELRSLPPVVVQASAETLAGPGMASFARLLLSGKPIQVLTVRGPLGIDEVYGRAADFGNLALAYRDAFVLQSSLAASAHLLGGLAAMTRCLRPAVAVVAVPSANVAVFSDCALLADTRTFPLFGYDPERGDSWSSRMTVEPASFGTLTPAHAAALLPSLRHCFRLIPESAWDAEQMELNAYLTAYAKRPPLAVPYLLVADGKGGFARAILTRALVDLCRERARSWALLDQLATPEQKAVPVAAAPVAAEREVREEAARREGAALAIRRVVSILMEAR